MSRQTRVLGVVVLGFVFAGVLQGPATAGGGSWFDFDRRYYLPGDLARGSTLFDAMASGERMLERGPFYAYLLPGDALIEPPRIPRSAIPLGPIRMTRVEDATWRAYRASISFTVPQLSSGWHSIGFCNDPCRSAELGDFLGGAIRVFPNAEEARAQLAIERLRGRLHQIRTNHRQLKRWIGERGAERRESHELALAVAWRSDREKAERIEELTAALAAARAREPETPWWGIAGWAVAAGLLAFGAGRALARARRHRRMPMPPQAVRREEARRPERDLEPVP